HAAFLQTILPDGIEHLLAARIEEALVNFLLLRGKLAERDLLDFVREISGDLALEAAEEKRPDAPREAGLGGGVAIPGDGQLVAFLEIGGRAEVAGHEKIENGPEIEHRIFDGGAGQDKPVA